MAGFQNRPGVMTRTEDRGHGKQRSNMGGMTGLSSTLHLTTKKMHLTSLIM